MINRIIKKINKTIKRRFRSFERKKNNVEFVNPNILFRPLTTKNPIVIDVGCGYAADFSRLMIERFNATAYAIDPTKKHYKPLEDLVANYNGKLIHLRYALSTSDGTLNFNESVDNESGSLLTSHINILNDKILKYEVRSISLKTLISEIQTKHIDLLKLDIEGAEYELLEEVTREDLLPFKQIFIEFHHHALKEYTEKNTRFLAQKISSFGFNSFSMDDHNYIFWKN